MGAVLGLIVFLAICYGLIKLVDRARGIDARGSDDLPNPTSVAFWHGYGSPQAREARRLYRERQRGQL